jgi:hypothetical protein
MSNTTVEHNCAYPDDTDPNAHYKCRCTCGYAPGTFACKIRHLQINTGAAKAGAVTGKGQNVEITPNGRIYR